MILGFTVASIIVLVGFFAGVSTVGIVNKNVQPFEDMSLAGQANITMYATLYSSFGLHLGLLFVSLTIISLLLFLGYLSFRGVKSS